MMTAINYRRLTTGALAISATLTLASSAWAQTIQTTPEGAHIASADAWVQCLDGAKPSSQNIPAVDISDLDSIPFEMDVMDTNPLWDEVILDFEDHLSHDQILTYTASLGLDASPTSAMSEKTNIFIAPVEEGAVPYIKDCLAKNAPQGWLENVEENFEYRAFDFVPDDPLYQFQWNFKQVGAEAAWKISSGKDVVVAVIDTGVTVEDAPERGIKVGPDMKGVATVPGYDFVDKTDFVYDGHGHGTHVAGTIAQATNNGYGVAGLAFESKIMPIRVLNSQGMGSVADIADGIRFAADNGAKVINMSLGGPLPSLVLKSAVRYANKKGVTVIAAAGNSGRRSPSYPAAYKEVFAVAATQYDQHTTFYSQWGDFVDIAAPGGNTRVDQNGDGRPDGIMQETHPIGRTDKHEFALYMGTSMASPHVAAAAAMIIASGVTHPDKVKKILSDSADTSMKEHYGEKEFSERYGAGFLRVDKAVAKATTMQGTTRSGGALLLVLLTLVGLGRRRQLDQNTGQIILFAGTATVAAAGLFFLPFIIPAGGTLGWISAILARPLAQANVLISGLAANQNPLLASFIIPLGVYALLAGNKWGRAIASGLAIGMAAFCLTEAYLMTSDVSWIPGMAGLLDRGWLLINGLLSLTIGYLGLKK